MHRTEIRILKQMHQKGLSRFLERLYSLALPSESFGAGDEGEGDFANLGVGGKKVC